jgi:glucosamine-6-phosphate deaminase
MEQIMQTIEKDKLRINVYEDEAKMGDAAADFVASHLQSAIRDRGEANLILATGTSQFQFLPALMQRDLDWSKITVFHLDEYRGISEDHPASFRKYLKDRILDAVQPREAYLIQGDAEDLKKEIAAYEELLKSHPADVACLGIGENGHIAFNDPPVADFNDPHWVKVVKLDEACRRQQLGEGWFPTMKEVPEEAISLTIPAIMASKAVSLVAPGRRKAQAIHDTVYSDISTACPATILRKHPDTTFFIDEDAASLLKSEHV